MSGSEGLSRKCTFGDALRRAAERNPNKPALSYYTGDGESEVYTFREFNRIANRIANGLLDSGVKKEDRVCFMSHNCPQILALTYGASKIGAVSVPLNFRFPIERIKEVIERVTPKLFFAEENFREKIEDLNEWDIENFGYLDPTELDPQNWLQTNVGKLTKQKDKEPEKETNEKDIATIFFTAGTSGKPKGVSTSYKNYNASQLVYYKLNELPSEEGNILIGLPLIHMAGFDLGLSPQVTGSEIVLLQLPQPSQILELLSKHEVTHTAFPPTMYIQMARAPNFEDYHLPHAEVFTTWASTIPEEQIRSWNKIAPNLEWITIQGSTESTATALTASRFSEWEDIPNEDGRWVGKHIPFGADIKLVDANDNEVSTGEVGEQVVRGPVVMEGYLDEEKTEEAFRGGWFHTGDMLKKDEDGNYYFIDRKKDIIKTGGENVATQEVEDVIGRHPDVQQVAVFGVPHPTWGEAVTAAMVVNPDVEKTEDEIEDEIVSFCKDEMAGYKKPKYIVVEDSLPMSASRKLKKVDLRDKYQDLAEKRS